MISSFLPFFFRRFNYSHTSTTSYCQYQAHLLFLPRNMYISKLSISFSLASLLVAGASACLEATGQVCDGLDTKFAVTVTDDGVQTCSFTCEGIIDDCTGSCNSGYSATFDTGSHFVDDPGYLTYNTPHGSYGVSVPNTNYFCEDCCGGEIPCICCEVTYGGTYFGC